jgi:hypothetical protein
MVDVFDKLYSQIIDKNSFFRKIGLYRILRFLFRCIANAILPLYFILTKHKVNNRLKVSLSNDRRTIVALTTFPARINRLWLVIETLLRQTCKPDKIILWLSTEQFSSLDQLPQNLQVLQERGLEIRFCNGDLRSHKKYFYAMQEFPNDYILTVDDDVFYHSGLIEKLLDLNRRYPDTICCNCASKVEIKNGDIAPYLSWPDVFSEQKPSAELMPIGVGGVLYPPNSMSTEVFNVDVFREICFLADDIWLNIMARLQGTLVAKTNYDSFYLPVMNKNNLTLNSINNIEGQNDVQINAVRNYCLNKLKIDPFQSVISLYK